MMVCASCVLRRNCNIHSLIVMSQSDYEWLVHVHCKTTGDPVCAQFQGQDLLYEEVNN